MKSYLSNVFLKYRFFQINWTHDFAHFLLSLVVFGFPLENKYDKPLRRFSLTLVPEGITLPEGFEKKIYFFPSDIAAILLFMLLIFAFKTPLKRLLFQNGTVFLWIIFFSALLSACFSPLSHYPVIYTRLLQLLTPIFLYAFIVETIKEERRITFLLSLLIATALIQSLFGIIQYFTQEPLGLKIFNESRDVPASFEMVNGYRWIFDRLTGYIGPSNLLKRSSGTLNHSNLLGGLLALSILLSYSFIANAKKTWIRRGMGFLLVVPFFALCTTYSRSAIFGLILGTLLWFAWATFKDQFRKYKFLMGSITFSIAICSSLLFEQFQYRGGLLNYNITVQKSDQVRIDAQSTAIKMIEDHPILGVGFQQFANTSSAYVPKDQGTPLAHNVFLFITAEMGLFALLAFLGFIATVLLEALKAPFTPRMASLLSIFGFFLFVGCCDFYPIHIQEGKLMLFITAGLMIAEAKRLKNSALNQNTNERIACNI